MSRRRINGRRKTCCISGTNSETKLLLQDGVEEDNAIQLMPVCIILYCHAAILESVSALYGRGSNAFNFAAGVRETHQKPREYFLTAGLFE